LTAQASWFLNNTADALLEELLKEWQHFARTTESHDFKLYFEQHSQDYYVNMLKTLDYIHHKTGRYETLMHFVGEEIAVFEDRHLSKEMRKLIDPAIPRD
jgi:hypothetical protein